VVGFIGAFTAIFAASMGLVANDIKRVLAYSTVSQLGYMMLGLATGGVAVGIFHLFTHAYFKSLLFLGSGSVHHCSGTFDMRLMGGLRKAMPWTYATFIIGSLSLAGIWPLAGFWSKDEILISAQSSPILFYMAMITVFMTAFYMFRAIFMTFHGEYRGGDPEAHGHEPGAKPHLHESPWVMVGPLVVLAVLAVAAGWFNINGAFGALFGHGPEHAVSFFAHFFGVLTHPLPLAGLILALGGIFLAYAIYIKQWLSAEKMGAAVKPVYTLFLNKYYVDELYEGIIVKKVLLGGIFKLCQLFDTYIVDGLVNGIPSALRASGNVLRRSTSGQLQFYGLWISLGAVIIFFCVYLRAYFGG
jgi:NADH-quinone oxidoreductase subunit L